jgi:hypothetical protein
MGQAIDQIITAARRAFGYAEKVAADIPAEKFARKPRFAGHGGEVVVDCNHPAFVYGHLSLYPARLGGFLGFNVAPVVVPTAWMDLFKAGAACLDDPSGTIYPGGVEILTAFSKGYAWLFAEMAGLSDEVLAKPHPDENVRAKFFPTLGAAMVFMTNSHVMVHAGQISTWRRCVGMGSAM